MVKTFQKNEKEKRDETDALKRFLSDAGNAEQVVKYVIQASNSSQPRVSYFKTFMLNDALILLHRDQDNRFSIPFNLRDLATSAVCFDLTGQQRINDLHTRNGEFSSLQVAGSTEEAAINNLNAAAEYFKKHGLPSKDSYAQYRGKLFDSKPQSIIDREFAPGAKVRPAR